MLFLTGEYFHAIDTKSRLTIPARLREAIDPELEGPGFYAVQGFDKVLFLYTPKKFRKMSRPSDSSLVAVPQVRDFDRLHYGLAEKVDVDRLGRVLISDKALKRCGIDKEVAIIGVRDHLEVWDRARWDAYVEEKLGSHDKIAQEALEAQRRCGLPPASPEEDAT